MLRPSTTTRLAQTGQSWTRLLDDDLAGAQELHESRPNARECAD